jgi:hypothetical protein
VLPHGQWVVGRIGNGLKTSLHCDMLRELLEGVGSDDAETEVTLAPSGVLTANTPVPGRADTHFIMFRMQSTRRVPTRSRRGNSARRLARPMSRTRMLIVHIGKIRDLGKPWSCGVTVRPAVRLFGFISKVGSCHLWRFFQYAP